MVKSGSNNLADSPKAVRARFKLQSNSSSFGFQASRPELEAALELEIKSLEIDPRPETKQIFTRLLNSVHNTKSRTNQP